MRMSHKAGSCGSFVIAWSSSPSSESADPQFAGEMRITGLFEPRDESTMVTVTAENVPPGITPEDHQAGFTETLTNLARFVEPGPLD